MYIFFNLRDFNGEQQAINPRLILNEMIFEGPSTSKFDKNKFIENKAKRISSFDDAKKMPNSSQKLLNVSKSLDPALALNKRRSEYSRSLNTANNPSQDSGFCSHTSSFKLSSFQSVSSPIDDEINVFDHNQTLKIINASSSYTDLTHSELTLNPYRETNIKETCIVFNPPKLVISSSPAAIRKTADVIVSNMYRGFSLEEMSLKNNVNSKPSNEELIEEAFTPIAIDECSEITESYMKNLSARERSLVWKDSFLKCNKNNMTIDDECGIFEAKIDDSEEDISENSNSNMTIEKIYRRKGSERFLFSLIKLKQSPIALDSISDISSPKSNKYSMYSNYSSNDESNKTITSNDEGSDSEEFSEFSESLLKTPSIEEVRKFVDFSIESDSSPAEAIPLLGIEMHSISSETE